MKRKKIGFTLIEIIIVLALTVLIISIASSIFITGNKIFSNSDVKTTLQMEAKDIQEKISNICMEASDIEINDDGTNARIIFYDNDGEKQNNIEIKKDGANLLWTPISKDGVLLIYSQQILTTHLSFDNGFKIEYIDDKKKSIYIKVMLYSQESRARIEYPVEFSITLRNKI